MAARRDLGRAGGADAVAAEGGDVVKGLFVRTVGRMRHNDRIKATARMWI